MILGCRMRLWRNGIILHGRHCWRLARRLRLRVPWECSDFESRQLLLPALKQHISLYMMIAIGSIDEREYEEKYQAASHDDATPRRARMCGAWASTGAIKSDPNTEGAPELCEPARQLSPAFGLFTTTQRLTSAASRRWRYAMNSNRRGR